MNLTCHDSSDVALTFAINDLDGNAITWATLDENDEESTTLNFDYAAYTSNGEPAQNTRGAI